MDIILDRVFIDLANITQNNNIPNFSPSFLQKQYYFFIKTGDFV